ncbi:TMEM175 family protein [Leifsonia sp. L25]|uniref:TMEM175 family protein n=1 Tax=Actinomycetes TaxID=1760 RepID=UPI003D68562C
MAVIRTERGLDRLVNFSDATVAIAITLLILPLVDAAPEIARESFGAFVSHNFWELLAFAISFAVIARFWVVHHRVFEWVRGYDGILVWLNFLWLATIAFMPFTTNVLSNSNGQRPEVYALYIGNLLAIALTMQFLGVVLTRRPELVRDEARGAMDSTRGWSAIIIIAVSLVLAVVVPAVGMFWLFLMFLSEPLHLLLRRLSPRPSQPTR